MLPIYQQMNLNEQLKFNKKFCPLPFISYHCDVKKQRRLCCISEIPVDDQRLKQIRTSLLNDQSVSECNQCYEREKLQLVSRRQQQLKDWLKHKNDLIQAIQDHTNGVEPTYIDYDLRYSNLCNLECQMCNATESSSIALAQGKLIPFLQYEQKLDINKNTKRIYFAGGEPFLIKSYSYLLSSLNYTNCEIIINTNATVMSENMLSALDRFHNISFMVSLDGFGAINDQIRKNSNWNKIEENLEILANRYNGYQTININTVVQKDNVNHLLELGKWIKSKKINYWRLTLLDRPEHLHFSHNKNIQIPDEIYTLPLIRSNIENSKVLQHIKNYTDK